MQHLRVLLLKHMNLEVLFRKNTQTDLDWVLWIKLKLILVWIWKKQLHFSLVLH